MALIIFTQQQFYAGTSQGGGSDTGNNPILSRLSTDADGNLLFNGKIIGENSVEVSYNLTLNEQNIKQKYIALPDDCDTSKNIIFYLEGIALIQGDFWEVIEKVYPEPDLIAWNGYQLEQLAQVGDKVCITYYKKI